MKKITVLLISILILGISYGQNDFDPKVIVLQPKIIKIERGIEKQIKFYKRYAIDRNKNYLIQNRDSFLNLISNNDSIPTNYKVHYENMIEFASFLNFENKLCQDYASSFHEILDFDMKNPLVIVDRTKSFDNLDSMKSYAMTNSADYLINLIEVKVSRYDKNDLIIKPIFAFYDYKLNKIIETEHNTNEEFNKSKVTVGDTILNIYYDDRDERMSITKYIKNQGTSNERQIKKDRTDILLKLICTGKDNTEIKEIIKNSEFEHPIDSLYTTFVSTDGNNFLAVFVNIALPKKYDSVVYIYGKKKSNTSDWEIQRRSSYLAGKGKLDDRKINEEILKTLINRFFKENSTEISQEFWSE